MLEYLPDTPASRELLDIHDRYEQSVESWLHHEIEFSSVQQAYRHAIGSLSCANIVKLAPVVDLMMINSEILKMHLEIYEISQEDFWEQNP